MSHLYIDVLCAESDQSELIDAAEAIVAISSVLDSEWTWMRLNVGRGPTDEFDIRFYDVMASNDTNMSAQEVKAILHRCAKKGLRRCSLDTMGLHTVDEGEDYPRIKFFAQEFRPFKVDALQRRLRSELHILVEPTALFHSKRRIQDERLDNDEPWVDWLAEIFMSIARVVKPRTIHMYLGGEWPLPVNSHFAYFASAREVIEDIKLLRMAWADGLQFTTPPIFPIGGREGFRELLSLSPYRGQTACELVANQFSAAFAERETVSEEDVQRVLESKRFDTFTSVNMHSGFAVTDLPWFLDGWIEHFYLDVLGYQWWEKAKSSEHA